MSSSDLIEQILAVVDEIPEGKVATYGQIARLIDRPKNARLVGKAVARSEFYGQYPCQRVVNVQGRLVPNWHQQRELLLAEGVVFKRNGTVDLEKSGWETD